MKFQKPTLIIIILLLIVPLAVFAQEATPEVTPVPEPSLSMLDALAIVQAQYGDVVILQIQMSEDNTCWKFDLLDGTELCVDAFTGEIAVDNSAEATPEATSVPEATPDPNMPVATVTIEEAIAIVQNIYPNASISKIELAIGSDGNLVWQIQLDGNVRFVDVNAMDGTVYDFGYSVNRDQSDDSSGEHQDSYSDDSSNSSYEDSNSEVHSGDDSSSHDSQDDSSDDSSSHD